MTLKFILLFLFSIVVISVDSNPTAPDRFSDFKVRRAPPCGHVFVESSSARERRSTDTEAPCPTKTLILVILDESGSMSVQKNDVIGGYNSFLDIQAEMHEDKARLILVKFNTKVTVVHGARDIAEVPRLTASSYRPMGGTALYDAVSEGIQIAEGAAAEDERVLVLVMTDGEENASRKVTSSEVRAKISAKEALGNWTFAYIGENEKNWASTMHQSVHNVRPYDFEHQGNNMQMAAKAVSKFRAQDDMQSKQFFQA